jgi:hypothetical protein
MEIRGVGRPGNERRSGTDPRGGALSARWTGRRPAACQERPALSVLSLKQNQGWLGLAWLDLAGAVATRSRDQRRRG